VEQIRRAPFFQAQALLDALKINARRAYKRLALELHPDRTGGDQTKADLFVLVGRVLEEIEKTRVLPPPPPPMWSVTITIDPASNGTPWATHTTRPFVTNTTTTSSSFSPQQVTRVVKVRPR